MDNSFTRSGWERGGRNRGGRNRTVAGGESRFEEGFFVCLFVSIGDGSFEEEQI